MSMPGYTALHPDGDRLDTRPGSANSSQSPRSPRYPRSKLRRGMAMRLTFTGCGLPEVEKMSASSARRASQAASSICSIPVSLRPTVQMTYGANWHCSRWGRSPCHAIRTITHGHCSRHLHHILGRNNSRIRPISTNAVRSLPGSRHLIVFCALPDYIPWRSNRLRCGDCVEMFRRGCGLPDRHWRFDARGC